MTQDKPTPLDAARSVLRSYMTDAGRTAAKNLSWLAVLSVLSHVCALGNVFILPQYLGKERFGVLGFALTVQSYLMIVGSLGIKRIVFREAAKSPERLDTVITSHLVITGTASTLGLLVTLIVVAWAPVESAERVLLSVIALGNVAVCVNIRSLFDVHHRQPASSGISLGSELVALVAVLGLAHFDRLTLPIVGIVFAAKWTLATILHYTVYHVSIHPIRLTFSREQIRQMLASCWSLALSGLVAKTPLNSGIFFIRAFSSEADVAIMFLAQQVARGYSMFASIGNRVLLPHIAGPYGMHKSFVKKLILFLILFRGLLLLAVFGVAAILIVELFEPAYQLALVPMAILLVSRLIGGVSGISTMYAVVLHREPVVLLANVCACVVFVIGCLALVPEYSYNAVAVVAVIAAAVRVVLVVRSVRSAHSEASR